MIDKTQSQANAEATKPKTATAKTAHPRDDLRARVDMHEKILRAQFPNDFPADPRSDKERAANVAADDGNAAD